MTVLVCKYIAAIFIFLAAVTVNLTAFAQQSGVNGAYPPMSWQIMPGEDIAETARLVYPKDSVARDNLLRAIIRINPEHFPQGTNRSLTAGTIIQFPDLRTIGSYAKKTIIKRQKQAKANQIPLQRSQKIPTDTASKLKNNLVITQLIVQLENAAANESRELIVLKNHITALESLLAQLHFTPSTEKISIPKENSLTQSISSDVVEEDIQSADAISKVGGTETEIETNATIEDNHETQQQNVTKTESPSSAQNELSLESAMDFSITTDTVFLLGILFVLLIVFALLRSFRSIKQYFSKNNTSTTVSKSVRDQYETLLLRRKETDTETRQSESFPDSSDKIIDEVNLLIEQNNSEAAIALLQKQLAINHRDIKGWLQLFELLFRTNNKRDFKKNARRFKRMKEFPEIWMQIQELGIRLEPNESLYFNEQKRKEKFFSESVDSFH